MDTCARAGAGAWLLELEALTQPDIVQLNGLRPQRAMHSRLGDGVGRLFMRASSNTSNTISETLETQLVNPRIPFEQQIAPHLPQDLAS